MALPGPHQIRRVTIDPTGFTPVTPAMDCNKIVLSRGAEADTFIIRTDKDDQATERVVAAGWEYPIVGNTGTFTTAFQSGKTLCWVKAGSLTGTLIVESTR